MKLIQTSNSTDLATVFKENDLRQTSLVALLITIQFCNGKYGNVHMII